MIELGDNMKIKKKRLKVKKKNMAIFIIFIMLFTYVTTETILAISSSLTNKPINKKSPKTVEKTKKKEEIKVEEKSSFEQFDYYNKEYQDRYQNYKRENSDLSDEQIVKNVNMQLDKNHYEDTIPARNLNTEKILVNKYYYLDKNYVPDNLEKISKEYALNGMKLTHEARIAFEDMAKSASKENLKIIAMSAYRSYDYQVDLYNKYVKSDGKEKADTYSGRPGHSEHQTGLATDVYNVKETYTNFGKTKEYEWMQKHAHEYGFILRFPKDKEEETGYQFESWHYRYVGKEIAKYIKENNISFEEYYATIIKDW